MCALGAPAAYSDQLEVVFRFHGDTDDDCSEPTLESWELFYSCLDAQ